MEQGKEQKSLRQRIWVVWDWLYVQVFVFLERIYTYTYVRFCRIKKNKVVFESFRGRTYGDNPKYISEEILRQDLDWDVVWLLKNTDTVMPKGVRVVKVGSPEALRERASAKVWVDNTRNHTCPEKKKGQICLQTWHGGLNFKYVEGAIEDKLSETYVAAAKKDGQNCDAIISGCKLRSEEYRKYFWLNEKTEILEVGLPRNDALFDEELVKKCRAKVRQQFGIAEDKKVILYMPTFRDDHSIDAYLSDYDAVMSAMEARFGGSFVFVIRLHPNVQAQAVKLALSDKIYDGTLYHDAQELYMASDYMISDYSSCVFDFALLHKPVFLYIKDYVTYREQRGLNGNFDVCPFPRAENMDKLLENISSYSEEAYKNQFNAFYEIWKPYDNGHSAVKIVEWMKEKMEG